MEDSINAKSFNQMLQTSLLMELRVKRILKPYGMTHTQYHILKLLSHNFPLPRSPKEIKKDLIISSPDVTRILDRLVEKGWVNRKTCASNRRKVDVMISEKGKDVYDRANSELLSNIHSFLSNKLSGDDIHQLFSLIMRVDLSPKNEYSTFHYLNR